MDKLGKINISFYIEICCDECNSVIHNHMYCPSCEHSYAGTSAYGEIDYMDVGDTISCEECNAAFILIEKNDFVSDYVWKITKDTKK